ncbi:MAG: hypothetical protein K2X66_09195 [Cyanobacteria bacterium]|nr:hypothetical protein [Cyanobacteriota bacterium]
MQLIQRFPTVSVPPEAVLKSSHVQGASDLSTDTLFGAKSKQALSKAGCQGSDSVTLGGKSIQGPCACC